MKADKISDSTQKTLTIIVPAYNMEWCLEQNLQTYVVPELGNRLSVIVFDNSSEDTTFNIAKSFEDRYPEIFTCIKKENNGYGSSVNMGISMAKSKYVRVVDADDHVDTEALKSFIEHLEDCDADIVQTPYTTVDIKTGKKEIVSLNCEFGKTLPIEAAKSQTPTPAHHSTTLKTDFLQKNPFVLLENTFYVDEELIIYPFFFAKTICAFDDNVYCYSINNDNQSVSLENKIKYLSHRERVVKRLMEFYTSQKLDPENDAYCKSRIALSVGNHFTTLYMLHPDRKLGRKLAKEFAAFLKIEYAEFYRMVNRKRKILSLLNFFKVSVSLYERLKRIRKN